MNKNKTLEGGFEPPTLWLTATRSNQLSYSSLMIYIPKHTFCNLNMKILVNSDKKITSKYII